VLDDLLMYSPFVDNEGQNPKTLPPCRY
jgi:hypothetical protein